MRGYHFFGIFACLLFCVLEISSLAGGFERHYQHSRVAGLGGCGTGFRMGASSAFYNPGAMSFLSTSTASLGAVFYTKNASYLSPYGGNTDQEKSFKAPLHVYGVLKLNDEKSAIGISVNQPFGFSTVWPANWTGKYLVTESTFDTWFIQPTYSYKFGESFSAGLGAVIALGNRYLSRNVNAAALSGSEGVQEFDGSGTGFGVNAGVYYEVEDEFALGLTYRSAVNMSVNSGSVSYSGIPSSLESFYSPASWSGDLKTPSVISLGASYMPNRELLLTAEVNYCGWSAADDVNFSIDDDPANAYNSLWVMDNTITFRAGGEYKLSDKIRVRAGAALDPSPVPDDKVTPEFPDADRFTGSLGMTVNFSETFSADLVFLTENTREREVENADLNFGGTYKTIYNHFGFTVNLDF